MKRYQALLFFVVSTFPQLAFAECYDPSKVVIGFFILFSASSFFIFATGFFMFWLAQVRKYIKIWPILMAISFLLGIFSVMTGFIKEQNNNSDRLPFLSEKCE